MTITIDDPWQLFGSVVLALIMLAMAYGLTVLGMFGTGVHRWASFFIAGGIACGAVMLVMTGGGWL